MPMVKSLQGAWSAPAGIKDFFIFFLKKYRWSKGILGLGESDWKWYLKRRRKKQK